VRAVRDGFFHLAVRCSGSSGRFCPGGVAAGSRRSTDPTSSCTT